jgi:hypothetical protein
VRTPFPNNIIPLTRESPLAKYVYSITPMPTDNTEPNIASNLKYSVPNNLLGASQNNNPTTIKIDHRFSANDNFYAKANWNVQPYWYLGTSATTGVPTTNNAANLTYQAFRGWGGALGETHVFSPTFFVETLLN